MKKLLLLCASLALVSISHARPNADRVGVCYLFDKDDVKSKGACVISTGNGAGAMYVNIDFKDKVYNFEYTGDDDGKNTYTRDSFYQKVTKDNMNLVPDDEKILCHKHKPYDICYL